MMSVAHENKDRKRVLKHVFYILALIALCTSNEVLAQTGKQLMPNQHQIEASKKATDNNTNTSSKSKTDAPKSEAEFYKMMYENEKNSSSKFITLSQLTLGGALTILLGILGLQALFNYRINNAKIKEINSELNQKFSELALSVDTNLNTNHLKSLSASELKIKEQGDKLFEEINTYMTELSDAYQNDFQSLTEKSQEDINEFSDELKRLKIITTITEGDIHLLKNWHSIALGNYIDAAKMQHEVSFFAPISSTINKILECVDKIDEIYKPNYDTLNTLLADDKTIDKKSAKTIKDKLKSIPVYYYSGLGFLTGDSKKQYVDKKAV